MTIRIEALQKRYRRVAPGAQMRTLKSALLERSLTGGLRSAEVIQALSDVSFSVEPGEAFGVIGGNGSGKSTLLKIVAGILSPSSGSVVVDGRIAALIELGAGFHPEISGRENVYINGAVLGLSRKEIDERYEAIVEFSGLEGFMEEPVKNYSSGMYVRLGFAVAIHTDPDVLLVDEVLAVGDEAFAHRCIRRIEEFLARGKTLLFVSHSLDLVERLCDRVLWLEKGHQRVLGSPRRVIDAYRQAVAEDEARGHKEAAEEAKEEAEAGEEATVDDLGQALRWGTREAEILGARLLDAQGNEVFHHHCGEALTFELRTRAKKRLTDFVFGIAINTPRGVECWGTNTDLQGCVSQSLEGEATVKIVCPDLRLAPGDYTVDLAVHSHDGAPYDYRRRALSFTVSSIQRGIGIYFPSHSWTFSGGATLDLEIADEEGPTPENTDS